MLQRGDFISPTFNYQPRLNKPVLSYWIVAAFYKVFGVSVGIQRLPIALGGGDDDSAALLWRAAGNSRPASGPRPVWPSRRGSSCSAGASSSTSTSRCSWRSR